MPKYLHTTIDKFTFRVATDRLYSRDGVWALVAPTRESTRVRIGITDFVQQHNGDVAFVNVKPRETVLKAGEEFGDMETMKVTVGLPSPISGSIVEINPALEQTPEIVNQDPYGEGWLAVIEAADWEAARLTMLDAAAYLAVMQAQAEQELKS